MLVGQEHFRFLTLAAFELLAQAEKLAYLSDAMDALHGKAAGWSSLFLDPDPGITPVPPVAISRSGD
jgi:hypothetical protein